MTLRFWALEMALSTQKVGSFQKQQLCSRRQVVAITKDCSSFPERRFSSPWDSLQILSNNWKIKKEKRKGGRERKKAKKTLVRKPLSDRISLLLQSSGIALMGTCQPKGWGCLWPPCAPDQHGQQDDGELVIFVDAVIIFQSQINKERFDLEGCLFIPRKVPSIIKAQN